MVILKQLEAFGPFSNLSLADLRASSPSSSEGATDSGTAIKGGLIEEAGPLSPAFPMESFLIGGRHGLVLQFLGRPMASSEDGGGTGDWGPGTKLVSARKMSHYLSVAEQMMQYSQQFPDCVFI